MQMSWQSVTSLWMSVEFTMLTVIDMIIIRGNNSSCDGVNVCVSLEMTCLHCLYSFQC